MTYISMLLIVMVMVGVFGGFLNYQMTRERAQKGYLTTCLTLGVAGTFMVPLILEMLSNELIANASEDPHQILVFVGLCLAAAVSTRVLLTKKLDLAVNVESPVIYDKFQTNLDSEQSRPVRKRASAKFFSDIKVISNAGNDFLDSESELVMQVLTQKNKFYHSLPDISVRADLDESNTSRVLFNLLGRRLVSKISSEQGVRWYPTERGRQILKAVAANS